MPLSAARLREKALRLEAATEQPKPKPRTTTTPAAIWDRYAHHMAASGAWTPEHHRRTCAQVAKHLGPAPAWGAPAAELTRQGVVATCESIESREVRQRVFRWWRAAHEEALNAGIVDNNIFPAVLPASMKRPLSDRGTLAGNITDIKRPRALLAASWYSDAALSVRAAFRVVALSGHRIGAVLAAKVGRLRPGGGHLHRTTG